MKDQKSLSALKKFIVVGTASVLCSTMLALPSASATPGSDFTTAYSATTGTLLTESLWMGVVNKLGTVVDQIAAFTTSGGKFKVPASTETCDGSIAGAIRYESGSAQICNGTGWTVLGGATTDTTPNAITFTDKTLVAKNTAITSSGVFVTGFDGPLTAYCTNCTVQKGAGAFASSVDGFMPGDTITIKVTSSSSAGTAVTATVSLGNTTSATWSVTTNPYVCGPTFNDSRDGKTYSVKEYGSACWFTQNLNVGNYVTSSAGQSNNAIIEKFCYSNTSSNCDNNGGYYYLDEATNYAPAEGAQGICPSGWHIPTDADFYALFSSVGYTLGANPAAFVKTANGGTDTNQFHFDLTSGYFSTYNSSWSYGDGKGTVLNSSDTNVNNPGAWILSSATSSYSDLRGPGSGYAWEFKSAAQIRCVYTY